MASQQPTNIPQRSLYVPQVVLLDSYLHEQLGFQVVAALLLPGEVLLALLQLTLSLPQLVPHLLHLLQQSSHVCTRSTQRMVLHSKSRRPQHLSLC